MAVETHRLPHGIGARWHAVRRRYKWWQLTLFVIGVVAVEWPRAAAEGISASDSTYGAAFFMMTGMHAFHVLTGLFFLFVVWNNGRKGLYDKKKYPVEAAAVYWHFVDLVWIFFYPALYLIGRLVE